MPEHQPSQFQQYLAAEAAKPPLENPRGNYFHDHEAFKKTFSRYGRRIEHAVEMIIWDGQSLDWLNLAWKKEHERGDTSDDTPDDSAWADLNDVTDTIQYSGFAPEGYDYDRAYSELSQEDKSQLMREIIQELFGNIIDFRDRLSQDERSSASAMRTGNYYRSDYADQNTASNYTLNYRERDISQKRNPEDYGEEDIELGTYEFVIKQAINDSTLVKILPICYHLTVS